MRIVEHLAGHYEDQDVEFGKVYTWCPETVVIECECGNRATYERPEIVSGSVSACECGEDQSQDEEGKEKDKRLHPWRYWHTTNDSGIPF